MRHKRGCDWMKYLVLLCDGMADEPMEQLGGRTPLGFARTPEMDALAGMGRMGLVHTVPEGMTPGSDVANLSVLGFDPRQNYSGRSPLEALSVGVPMEEDDLILRCNLVTLTEAEPYAEKTILDHSAGELTTAEADVLMDAIRAEFDSEEFRFYTGTGYREIAVCRGGAMTALEPPHDHLEQVIGPWLPGEEVLRRMMERSYEILNNHPINLHRAAQGRHKANSLWFWGPGRKPALENFREKTGLRGAMISAVDLLKGIAMGSGMEVLQVPGANGGLDTNYEGKAEAAVKAVLEDGFDFVYIHVEAPDEMGHMGSVDRKIQAIENLDRRLLAIVRRKMDASGEPYRLMVLPDHPTPVRLRTHTSNPVPYVIYDSTCQQRKIGRYSEQEAALTGEYEPEGWRLMDTFLQL